MNNPRGACTCGHAAEEHGHDPEHPGSSACSVEGCECIAYEWAGFDDDGHDDGGDNGGD